MATKTKTKKTTIHSIRENRGKDLSPSWDNHEKMSAAQFVKNYHTAMQFYNLEIPNKDIKPTVLKWMTLNDVSPSIIAKFKKVKDWRCVSSLSSIALCLMKGMPESREDFNQGRNTKTWLLNKIDQVIEDGELDYTTDEEFGNNSPVTKPVVNIQERLRDISLMMCDEIETYIDKFITTPDKWAPKGINIVNLFKNNGVKSAHAKIIKDFYSRSLNEIASLFETEVDEDLKENYSCYTKKQLRNLLEFYREIDSVCNMLIEKAKVEKVKKPVSKDKIVEKLRYKKEDENLKIVSVPPTTIIGANVLWTFDTRTKKLYQYIAADHQTLSIKGTDIIGFDAEKSIGKTIRKPIEELSKFKNAGKVALRTFMDNINTLEIKGTGKVTEHQLLLKVQT